MIWASMKALNESSDRIWQCNRLTETSLPDQAVGISLSRMSYFHDREVAYDDGGTERPLAEHHRSAGGERSERPAILPGVPYSPGPILFLASQIQ